MLCFVSKQVCRLEINENDVTEATQGDSTIFEEIEERGSVEYVL